MQALKGLIIGIVLVLFSGCTVPRPPSYMYYDRGYYDDPFYYSVPYGEPYLYTPSRLAPYYSGSPDRFNRGYVGTYRGRGY